MLMTTVVAVALGLAPVDKDGSVAPSRDHYARIVGRFSAIDRDGTSHLRGLNRLTGAPYELSVDKEGKVEGTVGTWYVTFRLRDAA